MKELCEHFGVSQKTGFKWVKRYREEVVYIRARSDDSDDSVWCLQIIVWG